MRRKDKEITDKKIIEEIINKSQICRIALHDQEYPYIVPFNFGYHDNSLYFHSAPAGKKIELIKRNNKVCFEIEYSSEVMKHDQSCKWTAKYRSVMGIGEIETITGFEEKKRGLDIIMAHYGRNDGNVYNEKHLENLVVLRLTVKEISGKQSGDWKN
jgi:uncharacterized protein